MYKLRPYQEAALLAVRQHLAQYQSTLAVLATGLGKTVLFATLARDWSGRVLVMAHRDELIQQAAEKIEAVTGERPGVEKGEERVAGRPRVVVTSVQTMSREGRRQRFDPADFGLLVIDEAHHAVSKSYRDVIAYFSAARLLGVTATPRRADELAMGQVFESVAFDMGIEPASEEGWLVPVRQKVVTVEHLDFSRARSLGGDFNEGDLERILTEEKVLHAVAAPTAKLAGDESTIVFCVTVKHAELMAAILNRYKPRSADWLSGETHWQARRSKVDEFRNGRLQFLCNVGVLLEGFDAPRTSVIAMARPTKSLPLYTQVVGRATRPLPGVIDGVPTAEARKAAIAASAKPHMVILDYAGNAGRHKIVSAEDLLGGKYGMPVRAYARQTAEQEGHGMLVEEALERSADELAFMAEQQEIMRSRERVKAEAAFRTHEVSIHGGGQATATTVNRPPEEMATKKQIGMLCWLGVSRATAERYSRRAASAVISKIMRERDGGRAAS